MYSFSYIPCFSLQVIRLYGEHVLLPLGQFVVLEEIVNSCLSLSDKERAALLELPQVKKTQFLIFLLFFDDPSHFKNRRGLWKNMDI